MDIFIAKCLELCGGSKELLAQTFQTRFIDDGTPLFWVLCHTRSGSDKATSIPPLVAQVFKHSELSAEILKDMELACCIKEHKRLYQLIRRQFLQCDDDITASFDRDRRWICSIRIPHFLDKMLISRTVSAPFIHWCKLALSFTEDYWSHNLPLQVPSLMLCSLHRQTASGLCD